MKKEPYLADIPSDEYHEASRKGLFLSSHMLADFRNCPQLYRKKMTGVIEPVDSSAYRTGRALHTLILEGRAKFDAEYLVSAGPVNPKTGEPFGKLTKTYREWLGCQKRPVVDTEEFGWMTKLQQSVWLHPVANALLEHGWAETTVRTVMHGEPCQIRMDWFNPSFEGQTAIVDLKTCDNLTFFERDARRYEYPEQLAFYREVFKTASEDVVPDVYIIAIEKREPYRCGVWKLSSDLLEQSETKNRRAISLLKECRCRNEWPTGYETTRILAPS